MKNFHWICAVALVGLSGCAVAQTAPTLQTRLKEVRELVGTTNTNQVTGRIYRDSLRLHDLQRLGGTLVRQGKLPGPSALVDEKSVTLNLGLPLIGGRHTFQFTGRGESEDGLVSVFKRDQSRNGYQRTLGGGLVWNCYFFGPPYSGAPTFYFFRGAEQDSLHRQLRENILLYKADSANAASGATINAAATTLCGLLTANPNLIAQVRDTPANVLYAALVPTPAQATERNAYDAAIRTLRVLLPDNWDRLPGVAAVSWVNANLCNPAQATQTLLTLQNAKLQRLVRALDSLQVAAKWSRTGLWWLSANAVYNAQQKPLFNPADPLTPAQRGFDYYDLRGSANYARLYQKVKLFIASGLGWTNQAAFSAGDLVQYQQSVPVAGTTGAQVSTAEYYLTGQPQTGLWSVDAQASAFWSNINVGVDFTQKSALASKTNQHVTTFGIFFPIATGESVINLMPQVKRASTDGYSYGISLSASVPAWLTQ